METIKLLKKEFVIEILERSTNASEIISDCYSIYSLFKQNNVTLPFKPNKEREFTSLIFKFKNSLSKLTKVEAELLLDYLNLFISHKEKLEREASRNRLSSASLLKSYSETFINLDNEDRKVQKRRKREIAELLKILGVSKNDVNKIYSMKDYEVVQHLTNLSKQKEIAQTKINFDTIKQVKQLASDKHKIKLDKSFQKDPTQKSSKSSKLFNMVSRELGLDQIIDIWKNPNKKPNQLKELSKQEALERLVEDNQKYQENLLNRLLEDKTQKEDKQTESIEDLTDTISNSDEQSRKVLTQTYDLIQKDNSESFEELVIIKNNTRDLFNSSQKLTELMQKVLNEIEEGNNEAELARLKNKAKKKEDNSEDKPTFFDDLLDLGGNDKDGKKGKKKRKKKRGKKGKVVSAKTPTNIKPKSGTLLSRTGSAIKGGIGTLGGMATNAGTAARAGLGTLGKGIAKFAGPVGLALTAGMALKDAYDGFDENKANQLGFDGKTTKGKTDSAISSAVSGLTFGLVGEDTVASGIKLKDQLDESITNALGGKDSFFGGLADKLLNPLDNLTKLFDDEKKEEKVEAKTQANSISTLQNNLTNPEDQLNPLSNGFQNMFDYMASIPGIGEFFKDKASGEVSSSSIKKATDFFSLTGNGLFGGFDSTLSSVFSSVTGAIGGLFGGGNSSNVSSSFQSRSQALKDFGSIGKSEIGSPNFGLVQTKGSFSDVIASHETKGDYNLSNKGGKQGYKKDRTDLSKLTVQEVLARQNLDGNHPQKLFAVGKYQIIPSTLQSAVTAGAIKLTDKFDQSTQDKAFLYLTKSKRANIAKFIKGETNDLNKVNDDIAKEWASVQNSKGKGHYDGDGINTARTTTAEMQSATLKARDLYQQAIKEGKTEEEAYAKAVFGRDPVTTEQLQAAQTAPSPVSLDSLKSLNMHGKTKVSEEQKNAFKSGSLKMTTNFKAKEHGGYNGNETYFKAGGNVDISGLDPQVKENLNKLAHAYKAKTGKTLIVNSAFRSYEKQKQLYELYKAGKGNPANRPGYSLHEYGLAVDIDRGQAAELEKSGLLKEFGFYRPLPNNPKETQHVQPLAIAGTSMAGMGDSAVAENSKEGKTSSSNSTPTESTPQIAPETQGTAHTGDLGTNSIVDTAMSNMSPSSDFGLSNSTNTSATTTPTSSTSASPDVSSGNLGSVQNLSITANSVSLNGSSVSSNTSNSSSLLDSVSGGAKTVLEKVTQLFNVEEKIREVPTMLEQNRIETARQIEINKASIQPNQTLISGGGFNKGGGSLPSSFDRQAMFDDIIDDVGLSMFNKLQLG